MVNDEASTPPGETRPWWSVPANDVERSPGGATEDKDETGKGGRMKGGVPDSSFILHPSSLQQRRRHRMATLKRMDNGEWTMENGGIPSFSTLHSQLSIDTYRVPYTLAAEAPVNDDEDDDDEPEEEEEDEDDE
jgi:hypothetical protein